ncbi:DNA ligase D [Comamonas odontotermitis]|uniref:DNA ligase D n=1 Tax=Comamonas odontotermitis TaxID=379895 RepID=UPI0037504E1E
MVKGAIPAKARVAAERAGRSARDPLAAYKRKRDFALTPEPAGGGEPGSTALRYVIQKHWASRLHYDLRLELNGTMKSWAVPKGPSFDPTEKRMAVQVEDHPISYNSFEGQIPTGQYGGGRVIVWDRGYWTPVGDAAAGYRQGKLKFEIHGHKLQGRWTLVRMHGRENEKQPPWLLIKERDGLERSASSFNVVDAMPDSVSALPDILPFPAPAVTSRPARAAQDLEKARKAPLPSALPPQLATLVDAPPGDPEAWIWELKFDGYRLGARIAPDGIRLLTRSGNDWTERMSVLTKELAKLPMQEGWLDGEIVVLDNEGRPDFQALQNAFDGQGTEQLVYFLFDIPFAQGRDLHRLPLVERRELLRALLEGTRSNRLRYSEAFEVRVEDLVASACALGFEGVIGKRKSSPYLSRRSADWVKLKCGHRQEFVIGGFTEPKGSRSGIGSLLLGVHAEDGSLRYAGNVGSGFSARTLDVLRRRLDALRRDDSPFSDLPRTARGVRWVQPGLLAEVSFAEWTQGGHLRHPVFRGLRDDKSPRTIMRERPVALSAPSAPSANPPAGHDMTTPNALQVSHPTRVIDPSTGLTKLDLVRYYATVAPLMMEHLKGRPVSFMRAPQGVKGEKFFQKHLEPGEMPGIAALAQDLDPGHLPLMEVARPEGLLSGTQMNVFEYHTWNARKDRILRPDRMTFDLDPGEGVPWEQVQEGAQLVHALLKELGLPAFLKTSGGKGLHVVVPIKRLHEWDAVKGFSQAAVQHLARTIPQRFVAKSGPRNRVGRIFVDYLRNGFGATTASAWTVRARPGMGVSIPIAWAELDQVAGGDHWTMQTVDERLRVGNSPWAAYGSAAVSLTPAMKTLGFKAAISQVEDSG